MSWPWIIVLFIIADVLVAGGAIATCLRGLHFADIQKLLNVLNRLAEQGNTLVVIEHNLDVIKCADWIIDLGPEGGDRGGTVVATGPPSRITRSKCSYTGRYLKVALSSESSRKLVTAAS